MEPASGRIVAEKVLDRHVRAVARDGRFRYLHSVADRTADWMQQAERDLAHAELSRRAGHHEWACFAAQQSAAKAIKTVHLHLGQEAWGHVVRRLLEDLPSGTVSDPLLLDRARVLDAFYIPTRCANGHAEGAPGEHYGDLQSGQAIEHAREILAFARLALA